MRTRNKRNEESRTVLLLQDFRINSNKNQVLNLGFLVRAEESIDVSACSLRIANVSF